MLNRRFFQCQTHGFIGYDIWRFIRYKHLRVFDARLADLFGARLTIYPHRFVAQLQFVGCEKVGEKNW
jgi:hypothetical protein